MTALARLLTITQLDDQPAYVVPWMVRALEPSGTGGTIIVTSGGDVWQATEDPETVAQRLLDCQAPIEAAPSP